MILFDDILIKTTKTKDNMKKKKKLWKMFVKVHDFYVIKFDFIFKCI